MIIAALSLEGSYPSYLKRLARQIVEGVASEDAIHIKERLQAQRFIQEPEYQELYGYVMELLDNKAPL